MSVVGDTNILSALYCLSEKRTKSQSSFQMLLEHVRAHGGRKEIMEFIQWVIYVWEMSGRDVPSLDTG